MGENLRCESSEGVLSAGQQQCRCLQLYLSVLERRGPDTQTLARLACARSRVIYSLHPQQALHRRRYTDLVVWKKLAKKRIDGLGCLVQRHSSAILFLEQNALVPLGIKPEKC